MADYGDKVQALMDEVYTEWQKEESKGKGKWDILNGFSAAHQIAVVLGNFNYQVGNGGISQWIYNGYFHDDSEKLTEYLEIGAETDKRCRTILDKVYQLDQYAKETDCDRDGYYYDEDGESCSIGDMIDSDAFDTWYYDKCDDDSWWQVVCGIIDKVEGREPDREDISTGDIEQAGEAPPIVAFGERPSPFRDGNAEGPHASDVENSKNPHPIQVYLVNVNDDNIGGFTMPLPTEIGELQPFFTGAEIAGWQDLEIYEIKSDIAGLGKLLSAISLKTMSPVMLDELNYLAAKIEGMNNNDYEVFVSALEAKRHCDTIAELINLTENLDSFDLQPAFDAAMLGEHLLDGDADNYSAGFQKLHESTDEELRGIINYIETLEKYVDYSAYGKEYAENENGVFTENGYLTESGESKTVYRGSVDIPDEHRIFTEPGVAYRFPMKLDGEDIAEALVKIHAVCCENMNGAADALKTLSQAQDADYILMVNKDRTFVIPAVEAYKRGEIPAKTINHWSQMPGTRLFAIRIMDRGDNDGRGMTGDFIELNTKALLSNIARHSVTPERIEAFRHDGYSKSYDFSAWEEISKTPQPEIKSVMAYFPDDGLYEAESYFASFMSANEVSSEVVSLDTFLSVMNAAYMADAKKPQPDMLRVTNDAAKQILARGDADVFKLTAEGAQKLAPIEAARQMCFAEHRDLAIKREDISGLDKWAKSAVKSIVRQNERDERKKSKDKGEEL